MSAGLSIAIEDVVSAGQHPRVQITMSSHNTNASQFGGGLCPYSDAMYGDNLSDAFFIDVWLRNSRNGDKGGRVGESWVRGDRLSCSDVPHDLAPLPEPLIACFRQERGRTQKWCVGVPLNDNGVSVRAPRTLRTHFLAENMWIENYQREL